MGFKKNVLVKPVSAAFKDNLNIPLTNRFFPCGPTTIDEINNKT